MWISDRESWLPFCTPFRCKEAAAGLVVTPVWIRRCTSWKRSVIPEEVGMEQKFLRRYTQPYTQVPGRLMLRFGAWHL